MDNEEKVDKEEKDDMDTRENESRVAGFIIPLLVFLLLCVVMCLSGCADPGASTDEGDGSGGSAQASQGEQETDQAQTSAEIDLDAMDFDYSDRDKDSSYDAKTATTIAFDGEGAQVKGEGAVADGSVVTISEEGCFVVSGTTKNGQIVVDAPEEDKVQIVLNVASIHNESGPAVYAKQADKVFVTLEEGTGNSLSDGVDYVSPDDDGVPNAALYAECDLTINGSGSLDIRGGSMHAIHSKDDLVITGGNITATAVEDALRGRDSVKIADGDFQLVAGQDAVKANNSEDGTRGFVCIDGGSFEIEAADDAIHAESVLVVNGGDIEVASCEEGLEAEQVYLNGGDVRVASNDDGVNASARDASGSGEQADVNRAADSQGTQDGVAAGERPDEASVGLTGEAENPAGNPDGGVGSSESAGTDNAAVGESGASSEPPQEGSVPPAEGGAAEEPGVRQMSRDGQSAFGGAMPGASESCIVSISGGSLLVESGGDGIDSNGSISISGGTVLVQGPSNDGNSAIDAESDAQISGGTVLALGAAGMAQGLTGDGQASVTANVSGSAGDSVCLADADGNVLVSFDALGDFSWVCTSVPGMEEGSEYSLVVGGSVSDADSDGFAQSGGVEGGTSTQVTAAASTAAEGRGAPMRKGM
ncbi:MAG: carbohydrate-binding domain-containing protein [Eggerthellaceae bacterium]